MPTLGKPHRMNVVEANGPQDASSVAWIEWRDATVEEWTAFQGLMPETLKAERPGEALTKLCYEYGEKLIVSAGGFEVEDGIDQLDAVKRYAPDLVAQIGDMVMMKGGGRKLQLGKSDPPSGRSLRVVSAPSTGKDANT